MPISAKPMDKRFVTVSGRKMAYAEMEKGASTPFQHRKPTIQLPVAPLCTAACRFGTMHRRGPDRHEKQRQTSRGCGSGRCDFANHARYQEGAWTALGESEDAGICCTVRKAGRGALANPRPTAPNPDWLATSPLPKFFINAQPGSILIGANRKFCRAPPNQTETRVANTHFIQEDSPDDISAVLQAFVQSPRS